MINKLNSVKNFKISINGGIVCQVKFVNKVNKLVMDLINIKEPLKVTSLLDSNYNLGNDKNDKIHYS